LNRLYIITLLILPSLLFSTETPIWDIALPGKLLFEPVESSGNDLLLICEDRRLYSVDILSGSIKWKLRPGGKLKELYTSPDGSIILLGENTLYSIYNNGEIRWSLDVLKGFDSKLSLDKRGNLLYISDNKLYKVDRFGNRTIINDTFKGSLFTVLDNGLILYYENNKLEALTYSNSFAWSVNLIKEPTLMISKSDSVYLFYQNGDVDLYSNEGLYFNSFETKNKNPYDVSINLDSDLLVKGDKGITLIEKSSVLTVGIDSNYGLYYSNGILIKSYSDWTLKGFKQSKDSRFYGAGLEQTLKQTISLSDISIWGDDKFKEYFRHIILGGDRELQKDVLLNVEKVIKSDKLFDVMPNFYGILLLASSKQNKNQDIRQNAYRLIGLSRDISFLPYLLADLERERSYILLPYIIYALGQLGVDRTGEVVSLINKRVDDYFDEKIVINSLYSLYNINNYTNGQYLLSVFTGIEKILNGGYSRKIENQCYDIIKKIK